MKWIVIMLVGCLFLGIIIYSDNIVSNSENKKLLTFCQINQVISYKYKQFYDNMDYDKLPKGYMVIKDHRLFIARMGKENIEKLWENAVKKENVDLRIMWPKGDKK